MAMEMLLNEHEPFVELRRAPVFPLKNQNDEVDDDDFFDDEDDEVFDEDLDDEDFDDEMDEDFDDDFDEDLDDDEG